MVCEKSPARSRSVGTVETFEAGCVAFHCSYTKKLNILFFLMGLPKVPPHMLFFTTLGVRVIGSTTALKYGLRPNQYPEPWNSLVPDFIERLSTPPALK